MIELIFKFQIDHDHVTEIDLTDAQDVIDLDLEKETTETGVETEIAKGNGRKKGWFQ